MSQGITGDNASLCVTCGEYKPNYKFHEGDCTCNDCYDEGESEVNYELVDGEIVER